jgi:hypothetical protein
MLSIATTSPCNLQAIENRVSTTTTTRFATREEEDRAKKAEAFGCSEERKKFPFAEHFLQNAQNATVL